MSRKSLWQNIALPPLLQVVAWGLESYQSSIAHIEIHMRSLSSATILLQHGTTVVHFEHLAHGGVIGGHDAHA
jgi:hypothetical protein